MADQQREESTRDEASADSTSAEVASSTSEKARVTGTAKKAQDRFDTLRPGHRVGAHRFRARTRKVWQFLVAGIVGVALLTGAGMLAIHFLDVSLTEIIAPEEEEPVVEEVQAELDPDATIAVLNGTPDDALGGAVADAIVENEWGQIGFSDIAANREVQISAVFYTSVADESIALGLAKELGGVSTYQSYDYTKYGVQLVVLLGADYAGPGSEAAEPEDS